MTAEVCENVSLFIDEEKVLILGAAVEMALESTLGRSTMVGEDAFIDREKVLTLRAAVVIALEITLRCSAIVGEDACCDFVLTNIFNLRRKMSDKDFSALDVSFLSLNRGSNLSEASVVASLFAASKDSSRIVF